MNEQQDKYKKLREDLKGHNPAIAKQLNCSASFISQVLNGIKESDDVIKKCLAYAKDLKLKREILNEELENYNEL